MIAVRLQVPELTPPDAGMMRVRDPETGRGTVVDWRSPRVREAYAMRATAHRIRTADDLKRAGVDRVDVPIGRHHDMDTVARPLMEFFRMRELRGAKR